MSDSIKFSIPRRSVLAALGFILLAAITYAQIACYVVLPLLSNESISNLPLLQQIGFAWQVAISYVLLVSDALLFFAVFRRLKSWGDSGLVSVLAWGFAGGIVFSFMGVVLSFSFVFIVALVMGIICEYDPPWTEAPT